MGPTEYGLLEGLIEPIEAVELTFRFYQLFQSQLASICEFVQFLDDALQDKFVCSLTGEAYHRWLLSVKDLTFKKACDIALGLELAHRDSIDLSGHTDNQKGVHKVTVTDVKQNAHISHTFLSPILKATQEHSSPYHKSLSQVGTDVGEINISTVHIDSKIKSDTILDILGIYREYVKLQNSQQECTVSDTAQEEEGTSETVL